MRSRHRKHGPTVPNRINRHPHAIITYKSHIDVVVAGLGRFTHDAWRTYLWGTWQVVWEQASAIGGFPPP
jgi:hypothetical protein